MSDIGFLGLKFTWHKGEMESRIDRVMANINWIDAFRDGTVTHLLQSYGQHQFSSDQRPLLVCLQTQDYGRQDKRPFRFITAWVLHEKFETLVREKWKASISWKDQTEQFTEAYFKWNREIFRLTDFRKRKLYKRLGDISIAMKNGEQN